MEGERSVTVFNYCIGARPIQSIIEKHKKQIENVSNGFSTVTFIGFIC